MFSINKSSINELLIILIICGYPFFSMLGSFLSTDFSTIFYRCLVLISGLLVFFLAKKTFSQLEGALLFLFVLFNAFIMCRLIVDFATLTDLDVERYFTQYILFTLAPVFFTFYIGFDRKLSHNFKLKLLFFSSVSLVGNYYLAFNSQGEHIYGMRFGTERLNPISLSYSIVVCYLICTSFFIEKKVFLILLFIVSLFLVFPTGSRGGMFSLCVVFLIQLYYESNVKFNFFLILTSSLFSVFIVLSLAKNYILVNLPEFEFVLQRIGLTDGDRSSDLTSGRAVLWSDSFEQFASNPIFGDAIVERNSNYYPHNIFLESLMSIGVAGTIFLLFFLFLTFYTSKGFYKDKFTRFFFLYFLVFLINSNFSGSIVGSYELYCSSIILISYICFLKRFKH